MIGTLLCPVCALLEVRGEKKLTYADIWFHRYENGRDIEGRCRTPPTPPNNRV